jgi:hypothetical protein
MIENIASMNATFFDYFEINGNNNKMAIINPFIIHIYKKFFEKYIIHDYIYSIKLRTKLPIAYDKVPKRNINI